MTMKEHSIDQIWYTWSTVGVDNLPLRGGYFRVRAASRDRSDLQGEFFQRFIRPHLDYRLPQGIDPYTISLEKSPVCLAFINSPYGKLLIHKVYAGNDGFNRPGNFFTHILFGLPENFSARDAIRLWKSPIWQTRDDPEQPIQLKPLLLDKLKLTEQSFDFISIEDQLGQLIHAYLAPDRLQKRVLITGTSEQVAALIWGLTHSIPTTLLPPYFTFISYENNPTFISYENNPDRFNKTLIGTTTSHQLEISSAQPSLRFISVTRQHQYWEQDIEDATASYANFATARLIETMSGSSSNGRSLELESRIEEAERLNISDVKAFIQPKEQLAVPPPVAPIPPDAIIVLPPVAPIPPAIKRWTTAAIIPFLISKVSIIVFVSLLVSSLGLILSSFFAATSLLFISQMAIFTTLICFTPTLIYWFTKRQDRVFHAILESSLFIVLFVIFDLWLFGSRAIGIWICYAAALIVLIEGGSQAVEWQKAAILKRLSKGISFRNIQTDVMTIEMIFHQELVLYFSMPLGLIVGTIIGLLQRQNPSSIVLTCFQIVFILASVILLYFLVIGFQRMSKPLFATDQVRSPELIVKKREGPAWILEIAAPPTSQGQNQKDLDVAHDVSDLRKVYKYDALHNTLLVVVLLATVLNLRGITINFLWLITTLLVFAFIFSELPYAIGQYLLHERMLERYTGIEHLERKKKLEEYAPLFPPWALLAGLTTVASIGGFFFLLLNLFIQSGLLGK